MVRKLNVTEKGSSGSSWPGKFYSSCNEKSLRSFESKRNTTCGVCCKSSLLYREIGLLLSGKKRDKNRELEEGAWTAQGGGVGEK